MNNPTQLSILAITLTVALTGCTDSQVQAVDKSPRPVNVIELGDHKAKYQQYFAGSLQSAAKAEVAFRVPGTIETVFVAPGDHVIKGQILAQLDPHDYQVALLELQARLAEAESSHKLAESELRRVKQAISENAIATVNLDRARSAYERTKAAISIVQQNITKAEDAIRYTTLRAPFDGVIGAQHAEQFEQVLPGVPVFKVHRPNELEAVIDVPESLIQHFHQGQAAQIFWHGKAEKLTAVAKEVGTVPHAIKQTYTVTFTLTQTDESALPGKSVIVEADFGSAANVFCLPYSTVFKREGQHYVYGVTQQQAIPHAVNVSNMLGDEICVSGELQQGDIIITSGVGFLKPEQAVGELIFADKQ